MAGHPLIRKLLAASVAAGLSAAPAARAAKAPPPPPFSTAAEQCIAPAAEYHRVNPYLLRAILRVDSSLDPKAISRDRNGTVDIGIRRD